MKVTIFNTITAAIGFGKAIQYALTDVDAADPLVLLAILGGTVLVSFLGTFALCWYDCHKATKREKEYVEMLKKTERYS